jgi:hypothetical protein
VKTLLTTIAIMTTTLAAGCVTTTLAPGAAQVRIVHTPSDVAGCKAVGNVGGELPKSFADAQNLTVGLGGNTLFVTKQDFGGSFLNGVAYQCP